MTKPAVRPPFPRCRALEPDLENRIADFLDGVTNGEELLHALYDHVLDEPVPESMRALLAG
jgi:hypothetical protein